MKRRPARWRGPEARRTLATLLALLLCAACSGTRKDRRPPPPQTVTEFRPQAVPPPEAPAPPPEPETLIVIDPGKPDAEEPRSLAQASRDERERRESTGRPIAVITDQTLGEYAAAGDLTLVEGGAPAPAEGATEAEEDGPPSPATEPGGEEYWRGRVRDLRLRWREAAERARELEARIGDLRRRFYAEDDPYLRDSQIKPAWDRALDRLAEARASVDALQEELGSALEEGRRAGALPGWLREGIELEPDPEGPEPQPAEPGEPQIVGEDGREP